MGQIQQPHPVTLISGILAGEEALFTAARSELQAVFGEVDMVSELWPFESTHYYQRELGDRILRQFVSFDEPFSMERLKAVKHASNELEEDFVRKLGRPVGLRPINLDPGFISLGSLVLATTKERAHRIYLGDGIFAETTLLFESGAWRSCPWTYPDYASPLYHPFFTRVRETLKRRRRCERPRNADNFKQPPTNRE